MVPVTLCYGGVQEPAGEKELQEQHCTCYTVLRWWLAVGIGGAGGGGVGPQPLRSKEMIAAPAITSPSLPTSS